MSKLLDTLIAFGGKATATKSEGGVVKATGYLVRFTTADDPDITALKDFFNAETYYGEASSVPVYFHHGLPVVVTDAAGATKTIGPGKSKIGVGSLKTDDTGIFIDAVLDESAEFAAAVQQLLDAGVLGWSSGAASHLVEREAIAGDGGVVKAHWIKQWLMAEGSLTHMPAEPRNVAASATKTAPIVRPGVMTKSALARYGNYGWDYEHGYDDDWSPTEEIVDSIAWTFTSRLRRALCNIACDENMSPAEQVAAMNACFVEAQTLVVGVVASLSGTLGEAEADATKTKVEAAFKTWAPEGEEPAFAVAGFAKGIGSLSLADHGAKALAGVAAYVKRAETVQLMRKSAGRSLSATHAETAAAAKSLLDGLLTSLTQREKAPAADPPAPLPEPPKPADAAKSLADAQALARSLGVAI